MLGLHLLYAAQHSTLKYVGQENTRSVGVIHIPGYVEYGCMICLVIFSDLVTAFKADILPEVEKEAIGNLLTKGRRSKTGKTKTLATWSTREIRKLKNVSW